MPTKKEMKQGRNFRDYSDDYAHQNPSSFSITYLSPGEKEMMDTDEEDEEEIANAFDQANKVANDYYNRHNPKNLPPMRHTPLGISLMGSHEMGSNKDDRSYQVRQIKMPKIKNNSLVTYCFDILISSKTPIHITEIISVLHRKKKLKKESSLHHYSTVHKTLSRNHHLFHRIEKGFFTVREGFRKSQVKPVAMKEEKSVFDSATVLNLVETALFEIMPDKKATASEIYVSLKGLGFTGKFGQIKDALKNRKFRKKLEIYSIR